MKSPDIFKRTLAAVLAFIITASLFACAEDSQSATDTSAAETTEETEDLYPDDMPDMMNFDGQAIRFITFQVDRDARSIDIDEAEQDTGDIINEAVWKRNQALESRLNVDIQLLKETGMNQLANAVGMFIQANSDDYDIIVGHARFDIQLASRGYLKNLDNLNYLNFEKPYWSQMYMDEIAYKDVHYWSTGDITISYISTIYCMYVNSGLWTDLYKEQTIYDVVNNGTWTLDSLKQYSIGAYQDINGDSKSDENDIFGFAMQQGHVLNGMAFASGVDYSTRDAEGNITITVNNEHTIDVFNKLYNLFFESGNATLLLANDKFDATALAMFVDNRLLFFPSTFGTCENEKMRAMETDYFIIPLPKYDESQPKYIVNQYDGVPLYGVPITASLGNLDGIGATLEALGSMSSSMITPVYYDLALKNKYSRDEQSAAMLDLIHDSITTDFAFTWGDTVGGMLNLFYDNIRNTKFASVIAKQEKAWNKNLSKLVENLEKYMDM
jgi:hypothetical protein